MDNKKTLVLRLPIGLQVAFGTLFIVLTYINNLYLHGNTNFVHSLSVGSCQIAAFYGYCYLIKLSFDRRRRRFAYSSLLLFSLVLPMLAPVLVYILLPWIGVELQYADAAFDLKEFSAKVFLALKTVWIAAGLHYVFYRKEVVQRRVFELEQEATNREKEVLEMKNDQLLNAGQSHYAKHVMNDVVARAASAGDTYTAEQVAHIGKTFDYVADAVRQGVPVVSIHRALAYFHQVVASIRRRHDDKEQVICIEIEGEPTMQVIGALTLTTLLENSDTHGLVNRKHPIKVKFSLSRGYLQFTCTNAKRKDGQQVRSTGQGLKLVEQELALLSRHEVSLKIEEDEKFYTVCLTIIYQ